MSSESRILLGSKAVRLAILHKDLLPLKYLLCAGGCGRRAEQYHHFNGYEDWQLLDVIPVCRYCHSIADRIRNHVGVDLDRPEAQNILAAVEKEKNIHRRRRLYLMKEYNNTEYWCRFMVSKPGSNPAVIHSDLHISAFSEYVQSKHLKNIDLNIECVLCGCSPTLEFEKCMCSCH